MYFISINMCKLFICALLFICVSRVFARILPLFGNIRGVTPPPPLQVATPLSTNIVSNSVQSFIPPFFVQFTIPAKRLGAIPGCTHILDLAGCAAGQGIR